MNRLALLRMVHRPALLAAPYVVMDDGRVSRRPLIRLVRSCKTSAVAHIIRALSTQLAGEKEPVAMCRVDLSGFELTNDLGDGVDVGRAVRVSA